MLPIPARPIIKKTVYELLQQTALNVSNWSIKQNGDQIENPKNNIGRNTMWSFVGEPSEPIVLCIWYKDVDWSATPPIYKGNERTFQAQLNDLNTRKGNNGISRLTVKLQRSSAFHQAIYQAYKNTCCVRLILVDGEQIDIEDAADEASKVTARILDSETWYVHEMNSDNGDYTIARGVLPPPRPSEQLKEELTDPLNDPAFQTYLATLSDTERDAMVKTRVCQGKFRDRLIERWKTCSVTGCGITEILIASHIRPWSKCETAEQRLSPANGLLLVPNLDKLFDSGFISFDDNYRIIFSSRLKLDFALQLSVNQNMRLRKNNHVDMLPYLQWHREHVLLK
ncbi:HNH endonuclease [Deefgea tanakiae]|uniref:HNH endonuclease n=1 Tax=Deefgea tanakiae TaxID=2865840 RepID=A0ABX8Z546_9NEIS|nr:HNH endonuclease [Deefgea tanakiae]QZA77447.1 HNH endonuclease [Deefgea tanakiae]